MSRQIKVTDRRMFTPDGRLREEYQEIEATAPPEPEKKVESEPPPGAAAPAEPAPPEERRPAGERQAEPPEPGEPKAGFMDLVGLLAEHASIYLRRGGPAMGMDAAQSLELARLHIDLLAVLKEKTEGNLTAEERSALDEVLYQLKMGYVQVGG